MVWWASFADLVKKVQANGSLPVDDVYWSIGRVKHQCPISVEAAKRGCLSRDLYVDCLNTGCSWCSGSIGVRQRQANTM